MLCRAAINFRAILPILCKFGLTPIPSLSDPWGSMLCLQISGTVAMHPGVNLLCDALQLHSMHRIKVACMYMSCHRFRVRPFLSCSYPAELRAEVYYPWYFARQRPVIRSVRGGDMPHAHGSTFTVSVQVTGLNQGMLCAWVFQNFVLAHAPGYKVPTRFF